MSPLPFAGCTPSPNDLTLQEEFSKFRSHFCLSLGHIEKHSMLKDVAQKAKQIEDEAGPAFVAPRKLSGRVVPFFMNHCVQLVIVTEAVETRSTLMDEVRIRISERQLLHKRMKEVLIAGKISNQTLNGLFACLDKSRRPVENREHESSCTFVEGVKRSRPANVVKVLSGFEGIFLKKNVLIVNDDAKEVVYFAKCVTVVSSERVQ